MRNKKIIVPIILMGSMVFSLMGCRKDIQIFEKNTESERVEVSDSELVQDVYYVKNGTKFTEVYLPECELKGSSKKLNQSRVIWFKDDEYMLPDHYKGELVAYASAKNSLSSVQLERFEDMGYSIGIYGGRIEEDGYYHMTIDRNTVPGSKAERALSSTESENIRIVSIGGIPIAEAIDAPSGIIKDLDKDSVYVMEFYSGTYFYRANFTADTHLMRAYEVYSYGLETLSDTTHGYMCFNTPEDLKSGYYLINGEGLFAYHEFEKGEGSENEDMNIPYYENEVEMAKTYSQQYKVTFKTSMKDVVIEAPYSGIGDPVEEKEDIEGVITSPDGTVYELTDNSADSKLTITLEYAMAGDWIVSISPKSLNVSDVYVKGGEEYEETVCFEKTFVIDEDETCQQFWCEILGDDNSEISAIVTRDDEQTYAVTINRYNDEAGSLRRWAHSEIPYLKAGTYKFKVWYYASKNSIPDEVHKNSYIEGESYEVPEDTHVE